MEVRPTQTDTRRTYFDEISDRRRDAERLAEKRLATLLTINAETARQKSIYRFENEKCEAEAMKNPFTSEKTFANFGLLLGIFPPAAIFAKYVFESGVAFRDEAWILGVLLIVNVITATVGYFSGRLIGKAVREIEKKSWTSMLFLLPFVGLLWGIVSGGAGGVIIFVIGAVFGAILGGAVGFLALPIFAVFHRLLKKGEMIDRRYFMPLAFGITCAICAFILGL